MDLCGTYESVDRFSEEPSKRVAAIKAAVQQSYEICTSGGQCSIQTTIAAHGLDPGQTCKERVIRQVNKIGRYWGLCIDMAEDSRRYLTLFENISLEFIAPYTGVESKVHARATTKGFVKCHVHAEIQLLVYLDQRRQSNLLRPRIIGVNKAACYLCNLFFLTHGSYFITKTHGRLHELWTLPDLKNYSNQQRRKYRQIVSSMTKGLKTATKSQQKRKRDEPMQSYICLPTPPDRSPLPSYAATIISDAALDTLQPQTHNLPTPRPSRIDFASAPQVKSSPNPSVQPSLVQTTPVKHPQLRSRTPSPLKLAISSLSSLPAQSDSSRKSLHTILVQPSSRLPSPTEASIQAESHEDLIPPHVDDASEVPHNTAELCGSNPCASSSTIALHPLGLPLTQPITATHPLRLSTPGLRITVEMDGSGSGEAIISNLDTGNETSATFIKTDSLKPGEIMTFTKDEGALNLTLLLCRKKRTGRGERGCQLELSWPS